MVDAMIPNEETLFQYVLEYGFSRARPLFKELLVLAKDIRRNKGYGEIKIIKELSVIWEEYDEYFNFTMEEFLLQKVAREAMKNPDFRMPNYPMMFSSDEMSALRSIKDFPCQRVFFSALAVAKSTGNPKFFSNSHKNLRLILAISGENKTIKALTQWISHCAYKNRVFEYVKTKYSFYSVILEQRGDVVLKISSDEEFLSAGEIYKNFVGGTLTWCERCEKEFVKLSNRHKLCEPCSDIIRREKTRERVEKFRKGLKNEDM